MANAEHLEILKLGVKKWNEWREINEDIKPDLSSADLSNTNLSGVELYDAELYGAQLSNANLDNADLRNANLYNANLANATLNFTSMYHAQLYNANLHKAQLANTELSNANLSNANLTFADLSNAKLSFADISFADLSHADLTCVNFCQTKLHKTNFQESYLAVTIFSLTNLSTCLGLSTSQVGGACTIDFQTLRASKNLPKSFLLKIGLPEIYIDYLPGLYMDSTFYPVFLSHSWKNKPFARKLYEALIAKGVTVFFDEKKLKPGDNFYEHLSTGIDYYDKLVLICSKESLTESWWVDREIDRVLSKERELMKERGKNIHLLIPIRIDDYIFEWEGAKKEEILRYNIGDFREWENEEKFKLALTELIHALNVDRPNIKPPSYL